MKYQGSPFVQIHGINNRKESIQNLPTDGISENIMVMTQGLGHWLAQNVL